MKENIERKPSDEAWLRQKAENADNNRALFEGWKGGKFYRQSVMARKLFGSPKRQKLVYQQ